MEKAEGKSPKKGGEAFHQVQEQQSHADDIAGGLLQARGNTAQTISGLASAKDTLHRVAVPCVLIFLFLSWRDSC